MRILLSTLCLSLVSNITTSYAKNITEQKNEKPDVLFLFIDDMTFNGLHSLGNDEVKTPNMDSIIRNGVTFTNTYNMGGWTGAISTSSRSQLLTGMYLWNTYSHMTSDHYKSLYNDRVIWPQVMKDAGYKTFHTGKWHLAYITPKYLFDDVESVRPGMPKDTKACYNRPQSKTSNEWDPSDMSNGGYWEGGKHWSEVQADITINYLKKNRDEKKPLFVTCAFNAPHDPRQSPRKYIEMYPTDKIKMPKSFMPENPYMEAMASGKKCRDEQLAPWPRTVYAIQKHRQEYYAIITHLDDQIGRILKALKETGREKKTIIVFAADNGLAMGRHGLLGKQNMYEHSMKIPLAFCGYGIPKGQKRDQLTYLQDLVPTLYEMIGIKAPSTMEFKSELSVIKNKKQPSVHKNIYGAYLNVQRMIRNEQYKMILIPSISKILLFDMKKDKHELNNLADNPKYKNVINELFAQYQIEAKKAGDTADILSKYQR